MGKIELINVYEDFISSEVTIFTAIFLIFLIIVAFGFAIYPFLKGYNVFVVGLGLVVFSVIIGGVMLYSDKVGNKNILLMKDMVSYVTETESKEVIVEDLKDLSGHSGTGCYVLNNVINCQKFEVIIDGELKTIYLEYTKTDLIDKGTKLVVYEVEEELKHIFESDYVVKQIIN